MGNLLSNPHWGEEHRRATGGWDIQPLLSVPLVWLLERLGALSELYKGFQPIWTYWKFWSCVERTSFLKNTSMTLDYFRKCWQCVVPLWHWDVGTCVPLDAIHLSIVFIQPLFWCQLSNLRLLVWAHALCSSLFFTLNNLCQVSFSSPTATALSGALVACCSRFSGLIMKEHFMFPSDSKTAVRLFCSAVLQQRPCSEKHDKWVHVSLILPWPSLITASSSAVDPPPRCWLLTLPIVSPPSIDASPFQVSCIDSILQHNPSFSPLLILTAPSCLVLDHEM